MIINRSFKGGPLIVDKLVNKLLNANTEYSIKVGKGGSSSFIFNEQIGNNTIFDNITALGGINSNLNVSVDYELDVSAYNIYQDNSSTRSGTVTVNTAFSQTGICLSGDNNYIYTVGTGSSYGNIAILNSYSDTNNNIDYITTYGSASSSASSSISTFYNPSGIETDYTNFKHKFMSEY